jgi:uncharacterized protein (TIGR02421 family)
MPHDPAADRLLERAQDAFAAGGIPLLLDAMSWPRAIETEFFASGAEVLPRPAYAVEAGAVEARLARLDAFGKELVGDDALVRLLRGAVQSLELGARMLLALGTRRFYELSREAYGAARSAWIDENTTNLDFADHMAKRIGATAPPSEEPDGLVDAQTFAEQVKDRLSKRRRAPELDIEVTDEISAKVIAGRRRIRIRSDATFLPEEARSLYLHEVETHVFTAQNGAAQPRLSFLQAGGPRSTRTQEGLAVFSEFYAHALTLPRLRRLVDRVHLVGMAEDGASFVDLYRHLTGAGRDERSAYLDAMRVCRGGLCEGGAPFTKDAAYLAGFVEVYDFMRIAVTHDRREIPEVLVSGRFALDDVDALLELRRAGLLEEPVFVPGWVRRWDDLLTHFAFTSFLTEIDLAVVARRYPWL